MMLDLAEFHPVFIPGAVDAPVLLLLHGTGGDERDLLPLASEIAPGATVLSLRGRVLENGMPRFFKRLAEGVFDLEDLAFRTDELADFIAAAKQVYDLGDRQIMALGFSNGANIAASLLLQRPEALDGAILLRAMTPFQPTSLPDLSAKRILMLNGLMDSIIPAENARNLAGLLTQSGAAVDFRLNPVTHGLGHGDLAATKEWLAKGTEAFS